VRRWHFEKLVAEALDELPRRGLSYGNVLPDRVTIFQKPLEAMCRTADEIKAAVKDTVKHEIGHYFGLDDEQLEELMEE
jgi:predicted Zn-dependent protease with MMP-like domain